MATLMLTRRSLLTFADAWTWDGFLDAAQKCAAAGHLFGMPLSTWSDSVNWVGAVFRRR